ncbi:hypothetical protein CC80DRAFT_489895 [Byssothecium circinans]|uniref:Uncharacterized protein n=1 Tax=Byssothecium circinans TaxID=147558 RepID=A0A6A5U7I3_9PLEO|nr:hypothetical protein CC80DRAFT_489895 [Byssothecium circinans]
MAGSALQLFPPPPRPPRQTSPSKRLRVKTSTPEPPADSMDSAQSTKPQPDFHELVIKVNSVPVSPSSSIAPPSSSVAPPPQAHIPPSFAKQTPPSQSRPVFDSPPRQRHPSPTLPRKSSKRVPNGRVPSPVSPLDDGQAQRRSPRATPEPNRTVSPAFSTSPTLVRANSTATQLRSTSPQEQMPMRSIFPVYDPTKALAQQAYKPTQASPTHIPRTQISRSPYSPEFYVPHSNVSNKGTASPPPKPFFTPSNLLDNLWVATNGQAEPAVQMYTLRMHRATVANPTITFGTTPSLPFYSLAQANLAGNNEIPSIMNELVIQRHHPTQPRVLPIAQLDLMAPPSMDTAMFDPHQQDPVTLLTSIFPKLAALQALDAAANSPVASRIAISDPGATSPAAQRLAEDVLGGAAQRECCALTWTRDDPNQQANPWAQHLPSAGTYQLNHPTLGTFPIKIEGDCSAINRPSTRPVTQFYGHNMPSTPQLPLRKPASITLMNPYILSPSSPRANAFSPLIPPPRLDSLNNDVRPISITPSEMSVTQLPTTTDATADDALLARLDFTNDALSLNLGALTRFGNPFLPDVAASALLAVAVAEAVRGRKNSRHTSQENFEPPPPSVGVEPKPESDAKAFREAFKDGFNAWGGKAKPPVPVSNLRKWSMKTSATSSLSRGDSFDKDIELGDWHGQTKTKTKTSTKEAKKAQKTKGDEDRLPFVARTVISVLTFAFKAAVFVLKVAIKVVAGVVVMITRNWSKL